MSEVSMSAVEDANDRDDILITDGFSWKIVCGLDSNSRMSDVSPREVEDSTVNGDVLITNGFSWQIIVSNQQPAVPSYNISYHTQQHIAAAQEACFSSTHAAGILGSDSGKVAARSTSALDSTDREQQAFQQEPVPPEIECSSAGADGRAGAGANDSNNSSHSHHGSDYSGQGGASGAFFHVLVLGLFSLAMYSTSSTFKRKQPETSKEGDTAMVGGDAGSGRDQPGSGGDQPGKIIIGTGNSGNLSNTRALLTRSALLLQSVSRGPSDAAESDQMSPSAGGAVWDERSALVFLKQLEANTQLELETLMALLPDSEATAHRAQALKSELISVRMQINALKQELDSKFKQL
ncbi:hypothetical protein CEUSTIGMA_g5324.t1 [Chlamydomonas eustigma]|uniref:Uncharacterized protein n=1 Tax=Chlamydomonas eustigma TaxID=1157962 RepID=A0A250X4R8_9CHLO|nr:hypothetical protein CEUSTIGMA_g5324.t1 [Chlamydomonas eustigma]|eukprot:GAX77882.1 hypothetical protein CEUSTIGMA_g5324.t1 [Chlamydomonas eustigma]